MADIKRTRESSSAAAGGTGEFQGETGEGFAPNSSAELFKRVHVGSDVQEATSQWKLGIPAQEISNSSTAGSEISGKRKRKSDSSEDEAALKPYECRFCPMKFAKSQALGGHMNRHRQEREREQLLHARQLVLQQGLPWVAGQNHKLQRSATADCYNNRIPNPLAPSFQLSQSSLSWNISGLGGGGNVGAGGMGGMLGEAGAPGASISKSNSAPPALATGAPAEDDENNIQLMPRASFCSQPDHVTPYMVQQHATTIRASFGGPSSPSDMLVLPGSSEILDDAAAAAAAAAVYDQNLSLESPDAAADAVAAAAVAALDDEKAEHHRTGGSDFPSLQLGPCSSELQQLSGEVSPLQMAVDFECSPSQQHPQLLSLGGYHQAAQQSLNPFAPAERVGSSSLAGASSLADIISSGPGNSVQCDGLSWIFNSGAAHKSSNGNPVSSPCSFMDGFGLALGSNRIDEDDEGGHESIQVDGGESGAVSPISADSPIGAATGGGGGVTEIHQGESESSAGGGNGSSHLSLLNV